MRDAPHARVKGGPLDPLEEAIDRLADQSTFSGVVHVERPGTDALAMAYGMADRAHKVPNTVRTRFGIASGTKGFTALTIVSLIEEGLLTLETTARSVLAADLPLIEDDVTVEHLLRHRSGIGDYLDESGDLDLTDYLMPVPVQELATTGQYLAVLAGHPTAFPSGSRFSYCNGGYVVLALIAERVAGVPFHELVRLRVCLPAGMHDTAFLRSDELPGDAALGYLTADEARTNVFHLPVRGSGDGGIYSTAADISALWSAFFEGLIVSERWVSEMVRPPAAGTRDSSAYGLGFWLRPRGRVALEGSDAGVSFRSTHAPGSAATCTVISNTTQGAWPLARLLEDALYA